QAEQVRQELSNELDGYLQNLNSLFDTQLKAINDGLQDKGFRLLNIQKERDQM
ncbi:MAG: hypothetical protein HRU40_19060, partial [Saprospiraceae bacterium]|nr:hypothetical protein [Saprospiraceae bacterium]